MKNLIDDIPAMNIRIYLSLWNEWKELEQVRIAKDHSHFFIKQKNTFQSPYQLVNWFGGEYKVVCTCNEKSEIDSMSVGISKKQLEMFKKFVKEFSY